MRRRVVVALAVLVAGCATASGRAASDASPSASSSSATATDFTLQDVEGRPVRLSDFAGKVVLLDFWATWCTPCEAELPRLEELYQKYDSRGFVVLGVSMDGPETIATVPTVARRYHLSFPILLDTETRVVGIYNPKRAAPLSILVDRQGRVVKTREGYDVGDEKLIEQDVQALLAAK